jgi:hypothetical protein
MTVGPTYMPTRSALTRHRTSQPGDGPSPFIRSLFLLVFVILVSSLFFFCLSIFSKNVQILKFSKYSYTGKFKLKKCSDLEIV